MSSTTINADPYPWPYNGKLTPKNTAIVVIDMQNDFCSPGGYIDSMGYSLDAARAIIPNIQKVLEISRKKGFHIIHTREGHRPDLADLPANKQWRSRQVGLNGVGIGDMGPLGKVLIRGEKGWEIIPELAPIEGETIIDKPGKGSFYATDLDMVLNLKGIQNLVILGVTTDVCVHTTCREANDRGYECMVLTDCTAATDKGNYEDGLFMIKQQGGLFGALSDSETFCSKEVGKRLNRVCSADKNKKGQNVRIGSAVNLPIMDRTTELTDAFVEVKFGEYETFRTQIQRRTLNPVWNEDCRIEVTSDAALQSEPLVLKVMDYDHITYNDAIGTVVIDVSLLVNRYDSLCGIRGELYVQVKIQFFGDINPFNDSSAGVSIYATDILPLNLNSYVFLGLVAATDSDSDPEYHWADNFRTPRSSNHQRSLLLYKLSANLKRILGKKVLDLGGNACIAYRQYFDMEIETKSITARAIATAVRLTPLNGPSTQNLLPLASLSVPQKIQQLSTSISSNSSSVRVDQLAFMTTPKFEPQMSQLNQVLTESPRMLPEISIKTDHLTPIMLDLISQPLILTVRNLHPNSILASGGLVSAMSVKMLDDNTSRTEDEEMREMWWSELRDELKSHARALGCTFVAGYDELVSVAGDVVVLQCVGTAVALNPSVFERKRRGSKDSGTKSLTLPNCSSVHTSYSKSTSPFPMTPTKCALCKKKYVPEMLLSTLEVPRELDTIGKGILIEAHVCRSLKPRTGESQATQLSESLPFAQYDLHRQLTYKLRVLGYNAIFGLKIQLAVSEDVDVVGTGGGSQGSLLTAVATGTAIYVSALPPPLPLKVSRNIDVLDEEDKRLLDLQKHIVETSEKNRAKIELAVAKEMERLDVDTNDDVTDELMGRVDGGETDSDVEDGSEDLDSASESSRSNAGTPNGPTLQQLQTAVVHIDDEHDEDLVLLTESLWPEGVQICNIDGWIGEFQNSDDGSNPFLNFDVPGKGKLHTQIITTIKHSRITPGMHHPNRQLAEIFRNMYNEINANLSFFNPCVIAGVRYTVKLPKDLDVVIVMNAVAVGVIPEWSDNNSEEFLAPSISVTDLAAVLGGSRTSLSGATNNGSDRPSFWANLSPSITGIVQPVASQFRQLTRMSFSAGSSISNAFSGPSSIDIQEEFESENELIKQVAGNGTSKVEIEEERWERRHSLILTSPYTAWNAMKRRLTVGTPSTAKRRSSYSAQRNNSIRNLNGTQQQAQQQQQQQVQIHLQKYVEISSLGYIPDTKVVQILGRVALHFVKESAVIDIGDVGLAGMAGFTHTLIQELYAVVRAHACALGGNAVVGFRIEECRVEEAAKAAMGYAVVSVAGDVVLIEHE
ncbi:hypothetical protein HK098_001976 [Nowakowskiella sp. JEL0407]|nr:hypothetical protein HK098_001976 [Nowakowskiella sp. JEL0407]